jgi:hypothetical protein
MSRQSNAPRYQLVLAAEVVELPRGARLSARTSDVSRTGCYIGTLNPIPHGSQVRLRITHEDETLEATGGIVYASYGLGMGVGVAFTEVTPATAEIGPRAGGSEPGILACRRRGISAVESRGMSRLRSFGRKQPAPQDGSLLLRLRSGQTARLQGVALTVG